MDKKQSCILEKHMMQKSLQIRLTYKAHIIVPYNEHINAYMFIYINSLTHTYSYYISYIYTNTQYIQAYILYSHTYYIYVYTVA